MASAVAGVVVVGVFAWLVRSLVGARNLGVGPVVLAGFLGVVVGDLLALIVGVTEISEVRGMDPFGYTRTVLPYRVATTLLMVVVLEVMGSRRSRSLPLMAVLRPHRALRPLVSSMARAWEVIRIATRYGLAPLLGLRRGAGSTRDPANLAERVRKAVEEAGGAFVKLGQIIASRPDLVSAEVLTELSRLQTSVAPLPVAEVRAALDGELGRPTDQVFGHFDWYPIGSASIAQVHSARLADGTEVVVKIRRPGLEETIARDLRIARWLARLAHRRTAWGRDFNVVGLFETFAASLVEELDFRMEADRGAELANGLEGDPLIFAPRIFHEYTTERLLVMERLPGMPLSKGELDLSQEERRSIADALCELQVAAMLDGQRFHADPHPGNVLITNDGRVGLVDFGATGRLDSFERTSVFQMLLALRLENPTLLYESMLAVGAVGTDHDRDEIERSFAQFMAVRLGPGLPSPEVLTDLLRLAAGLRLRVPPSTATLFRALVTLAGTLELLSPGFPVMESVAQLGGNQLRERMQPASVGDFLRDEWAALGPLISRAPRHVDRIASLIEDGGLTTRIRVFDRSSELRGLAELVDRAVLAFLTVGVGVVSVMLIATGSDQAAQSGVPSVLQVWGTLGLVTATVLFARVLISLLRSDRKTGRA